MGFTVPVFAILATISLVLPFASAEPGPESAKPPSLTPVRLAIPSFGINSMPYVIAKEKGFFQEEGVHADFIVMSSATAIVATVSGGVDFNILAGSTIGAAMQGVPVKVVLTLSKKPKFWIFSIPEIRSMAELAGRTLAVGTRGGNTHIYTHIVLEKFGLTSKIQVLPLAGFAARAVVNSLLSGHIQAGYASDSTYFELKDRGFRELLNYADHIDDPSAGVGTSQQMIETKPEIVQAFVNASYRGMLFFRENREESVKLMIRYMKFNESLAIRTYDLFINTFGGDGTIPYEPVKKLLQARKEILNLEAPVPPYDVLFDNRFAAKLPRRIRNGP